MNSGNVTLTDVVVEDRGVGQVSCPETTLAPGATMTCTAPYALTQADVDAGIVENTATVTGDPPGDTDPPRDEDSDVVPLPSVPGIVVDKSHAELAGPGQVGDVVEYSFLVTNSGNVTLTDVVLEDPMVADLSCPDTTLAPGQEIICTASYELTQADLDAGQVENTATATGTPPGGATPPAGDDTDIVPLAAEPRIKIDKTYAAIAADVLAEIAAGDEIEFNFLITNTGNVTLTGVTFSDPLLGVTDQTCGGLSELAPAATTTCTATYTLTQEDIDNLSVTNVASTTGTPPEGGAPPSDDSSVTVPLTPPTTEPPTPGTPTDPTDPPTGSPETAVPPPPEAPAKLPATGMSLGLEALAVGGLLLLALGTSLVHRAHRTHAQRARPVRRR